MTSTTVSKQSVSAQTPSAKIDGRVLLAFAIIYIVWGSTFLAIRIAVLEVPPWFAAGCRFFTAGLILYWYSRIKGKRSPSAKEWRNLAILGLLMFFTTYGMLFWAEQFVPSGMTAVLESTLPLLTIILEVFVLRQQPFRSSLLIAVALGFGGVLLLLLRSGEERANLWGCAAILTGGVAWSLGSVLQRSLVLPESLVQRAGAEMMLGGGGLLLLSAASGELHPFPHISLKALLAILYLITFGSLIGYTAFVWLLARMPATTVSSHAYVNPVVAVALGYFLAGEIVTKRMLLGTALILMSVALILRRGRKASR